MGSEEVKFSRACEPPNFSPVQTCSPASQAQAGLLVGGGGAGATGLSRSQGCHFSGHRFISPMGHDGDAGRGVGIVPLVLQLQVWTTCRKPQSVPLPPTTYPRNRIFSPALFTVCNSDLSETHKASVSEFLFIRDQVCVILGISPSIKIDKVSLKKACTRAVSTAEPPAPRTHTHVCMALGIPSTKAQCF